MKHLLALLGLTLIANTTWASDAITSNVDSAAATTVSESSTYLRHIYGTPITSVKKKLNGEVVILFDSNYTESIKNLYMHLVPVPEAQILEEQGSIEPDARQAHHLLFNPVLRSYENCPFLSTHAPSNSNTYAVLCQHRFGDCMGEKTFEGYILATPTND